MKEQPGLFLARNSVQGCVRAAQCDLSRFLCPTEIHQGIKKASNPFWQLGKRSTGTAMLRRNNTDKVIFKLKALEYFLKISCMARPSGWANQNNGVKRGGGRKMNSKLTWLWNWNDRSNCPCNPWSPPHHINSNMWSFKHQWHWI